MVKSVIVFAITFLLLSPYFILIGELQFVEFNWIEFSEAFKNTLVQSLLSAVMSIVFGIIGALGLCSLQGSKKLKYYELACLIPSFLPTLFFVTALLQVVHPFPFGLTGIILVHALTYLGLTALFYQVLFQTKFQKLSELALIEGAKRTQFLMATLKNIKAETVMIFLFLIVQFFTSFSVPLLVGHQDLTIETLIFDKIRTSGNLSLAIWISFIESIFILLLLLFYRAQRSVSIPNSYEHIRLLGLSGAKYLILIPVVLYFVGTLWGTGVGLRQLTSGDFNFIPLLIKSISLSLFTGVFLILALCLITYTYRNRFFDKFLLSFIPLSTILIALSMVLVNFNFGFFEKDVKFVLCMTILFLPVLYRYKLKSELSSLEQQIEVASLMGSTRFLTFRRIVLPQIFPVILSLSGLGAFWAIGDFAISQVLYGQEVTLALFIQNLVGSYRLELANVLMCLLLFTGLIIYSMFRVTKQRSSHVGS